MANKETKENKRYFKDRVKEYSVSYFRDDEEYLVNKYFTKQGGEILVLGCGAGRTLKPLYKQGLDITAVDIVPEMLEAAKKHVGDLAIKINIGDATKLEFNDNSFDYVFFPFHGLDCIYPDVYKAVEEAARVLKSNGIFIFNSHNRFFLKRLSGLFKGKYFKYDGAFLYQASPCDYFKLKKYFKNVKIKYRISMLKKEHTNWKDKCYQFLPFLSISIYFICLNPKK